MSYPREEAECIEQVSEEELGDEELSVSEGSEGDADDLGVDEEDKGGGGEEMEDKDGDEGPFAPVAGLFKCSTHLHYEELAERKRRIALSKDSGEPSKKTRMEEALGATTEEIEEMMETFNTRRRRRRRGPKKRGRKKGSRNQFSSENMKKIGDATMFYVSGEYDKAIDIIQEVVRIAPHLSEPYSLLGRVYEATGDKKKAFNALMIAACLSPRNASLWKTLMSWAIEDGKNGLFKEFLVRAITADPTDLDMRLVLAKLFQGVGNYKKAADTYDKVVELDPANIYAWEMAAQMYRKCGQLDRAISILQNYAKKYVSKDGYNVLTLFIDLLIENNEHFRALQEIEYAHECIYVSEELPLFFKAKALICQAHLGNMINEEDFFRDLQLVDRNKYAGMIVMIGDLFKQLGNFDFALKYYFLLEDVNNHDTGDLHLKIAQCYVSDSKIGEAIPYFYKALSSKENDIDTRLSLYSILLKQGNEEEAILLLSPPMNLETSSISLKSNCWWLNGKVRMQLAECYHAKGMIEEFTNTIFPCIKETLSIEVENQKVKHKRKLPIEVLVERSKLLGDQSDDIILGSKPFASASDLLKASRAKKSLQKMEALKQEKKLEELAAGSDWQSDNSDVELPRKEPKEPTLPGFLKDEEHYNLLIDLCKALASLKQYSEALEIIILALKLTSSILSPERKEELRSFGAQIAYNATELENGYDLAKNIVWLHPKSMSAWNCYYKIVSRFEFQEAQFKKHMKFMHRMRRANRSLAPPLVMMGHQLSFLKQHQAAARVYLEAHKLLPDDPLINLCIGTSLINLALGNRLQNKHHCAAQGLAFMYKSHQSQEGLYNIARAFHLLGLVTLAAQYYEKVLAIKESDHPFPKLPYESASENTETPVCCSLRMEAAYNLHLIYKKSGAVDLARQVLKDYCCP